ncbi:MAG TPA: AtpZ/AtpI family protein [Levilinea sp.]|nr:AtpZ/AtpI family protein [Levilinea sp.]
MSEDPNQKQPVYRSKLAPEIQKKEARKLRARRIGRNHPLQAVGLFGMVGWSVIIPILLALALGLWIDRTWPSRFSWTLLLLLVGVVLGCYNAWIMIQKELKINQSLDDQKHSRPDSSETQEGEDDRRNNQ